MDNDTNNFWAGKEWLADDETGVAQNGHPLYDSNATQGGMYGPWQIWATWCDTTNMDNLRTADITDPTVAGSIETINTAPGHTKHMGTDDGCGEDCWYDNYA